MFHPVPRLAWHYPPLLTLHSPPPPFNFFLIHRHSEQHLQSKIDGLAELAKAQLRKGDKRAALSTMKKRKLYEGELAKIYNVKLTLETQAISLEGATQNVSTYDAMKRGAGAMASIRQAMGGGVEHVEEMLDEIKEEMELHHEVQNAFGQPLDPLLADDDDLLAELETLTGPTEMVSSSSVPTRNSLWSSAAPARVPDRQPAAAASKKQPQRIALFS